jgi:hypothetical protein
MKCWFEILIKLDVDDQMLVDIKYIIKSIQQYETIAQTQTPFRCFTPLPVIKYRKLKDISNCSLLYLCSSYIYITMEKR